MEMKITVCSPGPSLGVKSAHHGAQLLASPFRRNRGSGFGSFPLLAGRVARAWLGPCNFIGHQAVCNCASTRPRTTHLISLNFVQLQTTIDQS